MKRPTPYKAILIFAALALLTGSAFVQNSLNVDRDQLGLTRVQPLDNAPPVLAFTTVALGGFRGLISNALWIRANELQDDDKFFEMAQLADWITKLEPHFVQVWVVQAWNMAYNISVKFKDYPDRWRWVSRGIELLRDQGLPLNRDEPLIYRELAWTFQHKMGANLDDANMYYKQQWANEMAKVFGKKMPNLDELINPKTDDEKQRRTLLIEQFKMSPEFMKECDQKYGPLEWRLPEAHAIYWAAQGLATAARNPTKVKEDDLITLRRVIYQSMLLSFQRGKLVSNVFVKAFDFGPNLEILPKVSAAYEQAAIDDKNNHDHILRAHRNFLRDAVYFLYQYDRRADAERWFKYLCKSYPTQMLIDGKTNSYPGQIDLDEYAISRVQDDVKDSMDRNRIRATIEGLLASSYYSLTLNEDARAAGFKLMAKKIWETYQNNTKMRQDALDMGPLPEIDKVVLSRLLAPDQGMPIEQRAVLRSKLGLPAEGPTAPPTSSESTNAPPEKSSSG